MRESRNYENIEITLENHKNFEKHKIPRDSHENHRIPYENHEHLENRRILNGNFENY